MIFYHAEQVNPSKRLKADHRRTASETRKVAKHLGRDARKPVFGVSDIVRLKPVFSATETS